MDEDRYKLRVDKKMDFETTITKDKEHFLLKERIWFPSMTDDEYYNMNFKITII